MKILVLNGPNLNLLGLREPDIYGKGTYEDLQNQIRQWANDLGVQATCLQTNWEGQLVDWIQGAYGVYDGIVINPAAYTHTSIALLDAVKAVGIPTVEVHLSDTRRREPFRQISYVGQACVKTFLGLGFQGYYEAMNHLVRLLSS